MVQTAKNLPAMPEIRIQSLGRGDPLEKETQPTPVFLPGESHGQRSLAGYSPWDRKESGTTERPTHIYLLGCARSQLQRTESLVAA